MFESKNKYFSRKKGKSFVRLEQYSKFLKEPNKILFNKIKTPRILEIGIGDGEKISEDFWLKINGSIRQKGNINQMIFSISEQISFLSGMLPLLEGDLIFTGTPSGVGPIQNGDELELGYGENTIHSLMVK